LDGDEDTEEAERAGSPPKANPIEQVSVTGRSVLSNEKGSQDADQSGYGHASDKSQPKLVFGVLLASLRHPYGLDYVCQQDGRADASDLSHQVRCRIRSPTKVPSEDCRQTAHDKQGKGQPSSYRPDRTHDNGGYVNLAVERPG
jgi:hypothetical protein